MATFTVQDVKALRDRTGAGIMDVKRALEEASGDADKAIEILRVKGAAKAEKRAERGAAEGVIESYLHATGKIGVLVEVDCETDFVARTDDFRAFARDVALHIAAQPDLEWISEDDVPQEWIEAERRIFEQEAADKPENIRPKIVDGKLQKRLDEVLLLRQKHVNVDKHEERTIEQLRAELSQKTGENVVIRRFARFQVGAE
ncbi:MAG TPA: translation elongation factor Ts [Thermoleophilaceae bacterium]|jgi:elongation factor Ts|nr:translation elongation factor Ts [Thermoleophilaceae bacterium]